MWAALALCPAPCSAPRRAGACACGLVGSASPSARLPAPLREGRELAPAAGGQRFALCPAPCSAPRRTGALLTQTGQLVCG
ncbi:hypothetical protein ACINKY_02100 [Paenibacillus illinoisensis]|uniref:Uncharacterized protein n=1 Tax=Paenibacillus illinoisensis TaxID=59845 RepID=A0ABW8HNV4_9BACL